MSFLRERGPEDLARAARRHGVRDERVLAAVLNTPRELFVPPGSERSAYSDRPVPIPHGQTTSQPSLIAGMVEALELSSDERVLEIGTGYGYQTAILARLADHVWSVERFADLAEAARHNLGRAGIGNATVVVGDGHEGLEEQAPFDAIIVSAATPEVPPALGEQLRKGGRIVIPIGRGGSEDVVVHERAARGLRPARRLTYARFVPLRRDPEQRD
jgi:protein-L-isoaspartate(D-aspartate) O-methyltransferase